MNRTTLQEFRHAIDECFERAGDALFKTLDALLTEDQARSFPELSLSPCVERRWPSLSEAFEGGRIDDVRLRAVLASSLPQPEAGHERWTGIDTTGIERSQARTSADRSAQLVQNLPVAEKAEIPRSLPHRHLMLFLASLVFGFRLLLLLSLGSFSSFCTHSQGLPYELLFAKST